MADRLEIIGTILTRVAEITRELTAARARPFAEHRLSRSQLEALFILAHSPGPVSAGDLADALTVTPGAVTQLVGGLRDLALVESVIPDGDARVRVIRLTAPARTQVDVFERAAVERLSPRFTALDIGELEQLAALLGKGSDRG